MPRQSNIRRLPPELRDLIHRKMDEGATLEDIRNALAALGAEVSRSGLGRYKQQVDKVALRLRQSRQMAEAIVQKMGPHATEGEQGRFLVQMLTTITGDYMLRRMEEGGEDVDVDEIKSLARALKDTSAASRYSQDFELKIREEARKEAEAKLTKATEQVAAEAGQQSLTPQDVLERVRAIYRGEA